MVNDKAYVFKDWLCDQRYAEIETSDINNDDVDEAVITLSVGHGTGVAVEKTHVVDLATYMEIPYEDPLKIIEERVEIKIKDLNIDVYDAPTSNIRKGLDLQGGTRVLLEPVSVISAENMTLLLESMRTL